MLSIRRGWSGGEKVLGTFSVPGCPTNFDNSRARPFALAVGADRGHVDIFSHLSFLFSSFLLGKRPDID